MCIYTKIIISHYNNQIKLLAYNMESSCCTGQAREAAAAPSTRRRRRRSSKVWEHFIRLRAATAHGEVVVRALCPTCSNELSAPSSYGTSHLLRHRCYTEWLAAAAPTFAPAPAAPPAPLVLPVADEDDKIYGGLDDIVALDRQLL